MSSHLRVTRNRMPIAKPCILGNICAIIGPQNGFIFLCEYTDVEVFLNQLSY